MIIAACTFKATTKLRGTFLKAIKTIHVKSSICLIIATADSLNYSQSVQL